MPVRSSPMLSATTFAALATAITASDGPNLFARMGGKDVVAAWTSELYTLHASDPVTAPWFSPSSEWNQRTAEEVKQNVYDFVSSGTGGGAEYKGNDMVKAHEKMGKLKPISNAAFNAVCVHVVSMMNKHKAGGYAEMEEMWGVLMSLKADVLKNGVAKYEAAPESESMWDRMGGEKVVRAWTSELYDLHASDPLTAPWFPPASEWNSRKSADEVKEHVFKFVAAGTGGPYEYEGRSMIEAHAKMGKMKPITEIAFHAVCHHVMSMMKKHKAGGEREMDEMYGVLMSLKTQVMEGKEESKDEL